MESEARQVPSWDVYYVKMAQLVATKSKDRSTQVGCVLVGEGRIALGVGYNGFPRGIDDTVAARHERPAKYLWTEHAERNAIYNAARYGVKTLGATMYMNCGGTACADCARAIIQSGIREVVYLDEAFAGKGTLWNESCAVGATMLAEAGVMIRRIKLPE